MLSASQGPRAQNRHTGPRSTAMTLLFESARSGQDGDRAVRPTPAERERDDGRVLGGTKKKRGGWCRRWGSNPRQSADQNLRAKDFAFCKAEMITTTSQRQTL